MIYSNRTIKVEERKMPFGILRCISLGEKFNPYKGIVGREILLAVPEGLEEIKAGFNPSLTIGKSRRGNYRIDFCNENSKDPFSIMDTYNRRFKADNFSGIIAQGYNRELYEGLYKKPKHYFDCNRWAGSWWKGPRYDGIPSNVFMEKFDNLIDWSNMSRFIESKFCLEYFKDKIFWEYVHGKNLSMDFIEKHKELHEILDWYCIFANTKNLSIEFINKYKNHLSSYDLKSALSHNENFNQSLIDLI